MKSELTISATDVVFAIRGAYRSADACHCHTVAKLGADELLERLVRQRVLPDTAVFGKNGIHVDNIPDEELAGLRRHAFRHIGVEYLVEATQYSRDELLRYPNWGRAKVGVLERILARRGMTLRGADPAVIDQIAQEEEAERRMAATGDGAQAESVEEALEGLIELGRSLLDDGQLLLNAAARIGIRAADGRKGRKYYVTILRKYANNLNRGGARQVGRLLAAFGEPEEAERTRKPKARNRRKRRERHLEDLPSNVVRLVAAE